MYVMDEIIRRGADPANIRIVAVLAAPPALKKLADKCDPAAGAARCHHPAHVSLLVPLDDCCRYKGLAVYTAMIDEEVNDKGFIVPGLGDAGDRAYGTGGDFDGI